MSVILILLTASLTIAIGFLSAFIWSVKNGQYDDDYTPSVRMLFDNDLQTSPEAAVGRQNNAEIVIVPQRVQGRLKKTVAPAAAGSDTPVKNKPKQNKNHTK